MKKHLKMFAILLAAILVVVGLFCFVWFAPKDDTVDADPNKTPLTVSVTDNLKIAQVGGELGAKITLEDTPHVGYSSSGDGTNFVALDTFAENGSVDTSKHSAVDAQNKNSYVIELSLQIQSSVATTVYLGRDSFVKPKTNNNYNADYNNVNADLIAGAVRVAFFEVTSNGNEQLKFVWMPNGDYQLSLGDDGVTATKNGKRELPSKYVDASGQVASISTKDILAGKYVFAQDDMLCTNSNVNMAQPIVTFEQEGALQSKNIVVRIWLDGADREAHKAFSNGKFQCNLSLVGGKTKGNFDAEQVAKLQTITARYTATDTQTGDGYYEFVYPGNVHPEGVIISTDGLVWSALGSGRKIPFDEQNKNVTYYIRFAETATCLTGADVFAISVGSQSWATPLVATKVI